MTNHTLLFPLGIVLFTTGVGLATFWLERWHNRSVFRMQPLVSIFILSYLLLAAAAPNVSPMLAVIALCAVGAWSAAQVIYALASKQVRRFGTSAVSNQGDSRYCMRSMQPGWFWYHIAIYALQAAMAFVLPLHEFYKMVL